MEMNRLKKHITYNGLTGSGIGSSVKGMNFWKLGYL